MNRQLLGSRRKLKILLVIGIIFISCLGFIQLMRTHSQSGQKANNRPQTTVDVVTVPRSALIKRISLSGQTVPEAQVDIAAKYQGRITAVYASLGQRVTAGEVLVVQDTGDADIAIRQNQAAYRQALAEARTSEVSFQASYDRAKADYQRALASYESYKMLYDVGGVSRDAFETNVQQLADAKAALDTLANQMNAGTPAAVEASQAAAAKAGQSVDATEKQRNDLVLCAPRNGVIGYRQVEVGNLVQAGQKLLSIVDNSNLYVDCQVSEQDLAALSIGMNVAVQIDSLGKTVPGQIIYISPANDQQSLAFSLRIALTDPDSSIKSGMFARAVINSPLRQDVLVVPKDAVVEKNGKAYVFVVAADNRIEERTVQIGARGDAAVEILTGLSEGECIAVNNLARLRSGLTIVPHQVAMDGGETK